MYPDRAEVPEASGSLRKSRRTSHFNKMDLPGPSTIGEKRTREPSPARPEEPRKLMKLTVTEGHQDDSVLPPGLVYREEPTDQRVPWYNNPFHYKFIPEAEQEKAHGPFLPGKNSKSEDPYGKEPFPPCNSHQGDDPFGIEDICNIYDWIDSP